MNFTELLKKHPYAVAIGGVGIFVLVYFLSSKGSGSSATPTATDPSLAIAQMQAAQNAQASQIGAQLQSQQLAASTANYQVQQQAAVANNQIAAQANATAINDAYSLEATKATLTAQTQQQADALTSQYNLKQLDANVLTTQLTTNAATLQTQLNDALASHVNDNATTLAAVQTQYNYMGTVANLQAGVVQQQLGNQLALSTQAINNITKVNGSQNRTQILESAIGQPGAAAANAASTGGAYPSSAPAIIGAIGTAGGTILKSLFL